MPGDALATDAELADALAMARELESVMAADISGTTTGFEDRVMQAAFWEKHGLQCGFCTPGMIMTAVDLLNRNPDPTDAEIRHAIEGNYCRCTGYHNIVKAVQLAAERLANA